MSKGKRLGQLIEGLGTDWTLRVELLSLVALSGAQLVRGGIAQRVRLQSGRDYSLYTTSRNGTPRHNYVHTVATYKASKPLYMHTVATVILYMQR